MAAMLAEGAKNRLQTRVRKKKIGEIIGTLGAKEMANLKGWLIRSMRCHNYRSKGGRWRWNELG